MRYLSITYPDINNGEGCRVTLWVAGCSHHCKGCHNPESWSFGGGYQYDASTKKKMLDIIKLPYIKGLTLSGGDPLENINIVELIDLCKEVHKLGKDIWLYTGYRWKDIDTNKEKLSLINEVDVLVDGPYIESLRDTTNNNKFRGSTNQHIVRVSIFRDTLNKLSK